MARQQHPHVLVISYPAQGHVTPLMKLSLQIAAQGVRLTFVNTDFIHGKIMASMSKKDEKEGSLIRLVSIPDGLESASDRTDPIKLAESIRRVMPGYLEELILKLNRSNVNEQIKCVIAEISVGWALEVAKKMGIEAIAFWPSGAACLALTVQMPQLIEDQILNNDGTLMQETFLQSKGMLAWTNSELPWRWSDPIMQKFLFGFTSMVPQFARFCDLILCNSFDELDSSALNLVPNVLSIGPLLASCTHLGGFTGNFWPEDSTCLEWLDQQTPRSVIYVAFGSIAMLSTQQVNELAFGLELTGHPFLWVVRSDQIFDASRFDHGKGKFVEWVPQEKVLAHPSVACFVSHCGWNSTIEGLAMGVPFLCWPYFADQFCNRSYICDVWKIGLRLIQDEDGIITRQEISSKIEALLSSDVIKANSLHLKRVAKQSVNEGGSSYKNFVTFIELIKSL